VADEEKATEAVARDVVETKRAVISGLRTTCFLQIKAAKAAVVQLAALDEDGLALAAAVDLDILLDRFRTRYPSVCAFEPPGNPNEGNTGTGN
jgi:hypothetical protein